MTFRVPIRIKQPIYGRWDWDQTAASFLSSPMCALFDDCGRNPNSAEGENMRKISASARIDTAVRPCRRQGVVRGQKSTQFTSFGRGFFRSVLALSWKLVIRKEGYYIINGGRQRSPIGKTFLGELFYEIRDRIRPPDYEISEIQLKGGEVRISAQYRGGEIVPTLREGSAAQQGCVSTTGAA